MGISSNGGGAVIGEIKPFSGATIPDGWLACGGQAVSRTTYAALFLAIGTIYGVGDGATTFNLPDLRGRVLFGKDDMGGTPANRLTNAGGGIVGTTLGAVGGGESVTLTQAEMPTHAHSGVKTSGSQGGAVNVGHYGEGISANTGTSGAHKNIPPAMVVNYMIKA